MGGRVIQGVCFEKLVRGKEGKVKINKLDFNNHNFDFLHSAKNAKALASGQEALTSH